MMQQPMQQQNVNQTQLPPPAPDETGYYMPPDAGAEAESWVYGQPGRSRDAGQAPAGTGWEQSAIAGMNGMDLPGGVSSAAAQSLRMKNPVDMAHTHMPEGAEEAYQASLRSLLNRNLGYFVVATFQVGPNQPVTWQGILHSVGTDYVVLYQPDYERYISGDLYSLKFVQFHNVKGVPYCAASQSWQGH